MKKLDYCIRMTSDCLKELKILDEKAKALIDFARDYLKDAEYYYDKDPETALEAVSYAHGFIDAAVLLGLIEIPGYHLKKKF
ncbi:DUF357 domain-containing protein [Candidatus Micrarchaeota archaeon]|nr:MAG: DUF357 domain-containing protein [Candidatus Micrarchaeota archaeon]